MAFRLTPHERGFYPLFAQAAQNIVGAAGITCLIRLARTRTTPGPRSRWCARSWWDARPKAIGYARGLRAPRTVGAGCWCWSARPVPASLGWLVR